MPEAARYTRFALRMENRPAGTGREQYLPDWAKEKLEALRAPEEQDAGPVMGGIN